MESYENRQVKKRNYLSPSIIIYLHQLKLYFKLFLKSQIIVIFHI